MNRRVIIADAGPLIALARIEALFLLRDMFGEIVITSTIRDEIQPAQGRFPDTDALAAMLTEGWVSVTSPAQDAWTPANPGVDAGEASAIRLAIQWLAAGDQVLLVMDDRAGRLEAKHRGISLLGTAALLGLAKKAGHIAAVRPMLDRLRESGYFIADAIVAAVATDAGE